jgi:5-methylcytosine-specific restriction endonuclease McrA
MKEYAKSFYKSKRWQTTRLAYLKSVGGLCERCLKKGIYRPAVIIHHKVYLTAENINTPEVALSWDNLEAVCRECHEQEHTGDGKRYKVDENGRVRLLA